MEYGDLDPAVVGRIMELYAEEVQLKGKPNKSKIARIVQDEFDLDKSFESVRHQVKRIIFKAEGKRFEHGTGKQVKPVTVEHPLRDKFSISAWNNDTGKVMDINEYCEYYNLPREDIKSYKLVTHVGTPYYNTQFIEKSVDVGEILNEEFLEELVQRYIKPVEFELIERDFTDKVIRAVYTDVHIGMSPNEDGFSLFGGLWDEEELMSRLRMFCHDIIEKAVQTGAKTLILDDLGDFMDGYDGKTVRREHDLPQNMSTSEAFDVGIKFKVMLADILADSGLFESITMNNICNDNHAGTFGYIVNSAVKTIIEAKHGMVQVINHQKFISHYIVGGHCFIICHGKDSKNLKFGFSPQLNEKMIHKIDQYMKHHELYFKAEWFEFSKGDSHQMLFDFSGSDDFNYMNYPAFSPSSDWVQTNYKKGRSGYVIQTFDPTEEDIDISYRTFKWKSE